MILNSSAPITVDDITYDKLSISLALSSLNERTGVNLKLIPCKVDEGVVTVLPEQAKSVRFLDISAEADQDAASLDSAISDALQSYITAKGL